MGNNRPSLYAAFGNEESLFRKALTRYFNGPSASFLTVAEAGQVSEAARRLHRPLPATSAGWKLTWKQPCSYVQPMESLRRLEVLRQ
jgi:hypothetical protein